RFTKETSSVMARNDHRDERHRHLNATILPMSSAESTSHWHHTGRASAAIGSRASEQHRSRPVEVTQTRDLEPRRASLDPPRATPPTSQKYCWRSHGICRLTYPIVR